MNAKSRTQWLTLAVVLLAATAALADVTWDGDTDTNFENGANWVGGSAPTNDTSTDVAVFTGTVTNQPQFTTGRSVAGVNFGTGTWDAFNTGGPFVVNIGTAGLVGTGASYSTLGASAEFNISGATDIKQGGGTGGSRSEASTEASARRQQRSHRRRCSRPPKWWREAGAAPQRPFGCLRR